ncbi:MAG: ArsB/NhaD family transporter [Eubacterium sp.]|nr:ArsB/NhaD family transporter [Eubacterium sp.]
MEVLTILVFIGVMVLITTEKVHRTAAAIAGATLLLLAGVFSFDEAIKYVDFNTIGVLVGMMIFVAVVKQSGMFEYIAIKAAKQVKADPWKMMIVFVLITAVLSSCLDNVTTVLLVGPMTIAIARMLEVNPVPYLLMQILASNVGGTATLIGDPPNIMIGNAAGLSFLDFLKNTGVAVIFVIIAQILMMKLLYKRSIAASELAKAKVMELDEKKSISDPRLMKIGTVMIVYIILGFLLHDKLGLQSSVVALSAAAFMLIISGKKVEHVIEDVEWTTILFFISLFIIVGGMQKTGVIDALSKTIIGFTQGHEVMTILVLLWASALISSVLDNIPFVAAMIPLILSMKSQGVDVELLWWAISLGACLGGNGTLIGASANVVLSDISNKHGYPITFAGYLKVGFPFMIISVTVSMIYLIIRAYI